MQSSSELSEQLNPNLIEQRARDGNRREVFMLLDSEYAIEDGLTVLCGVGPAA